MPAQAAISTRHERDAREEDSNPPRLGRGDTRGSTEARDHFNSSRGRADHRHPSSKRNDAGATPAGSNSSQRTECAARLLSGVSLVRCQGEEPFHKRSASGQERRFEPRNLGGKRTQKRPSETTDAWLKRLSGVHWLFNEKRKGWRSSRLHRI